MDHVPIPEEQIVPFDAVATGVIGLRIAFVNVFAITHGDGSWTLIDAALPFSANYIRHWAEKNFNTPPKAIVLTHGHFDHVSAARELSETWDISIYAHPLEFPYLTGEKQYPEPNVGAGGGAMTLLSPLYPRGPVNLGVRLCELKEGGVSAMPGWQVIHTPGHTPGHISLFYPKDCILLTGDAFCTTKPEAFFEAALAQQPELHGPPSYFTSDWKEARASVRRLAMLEPRVIAPGHGKPIAGEMVAEELRRLAADFDRIAVPENEKKSVA